MDRGLRDGSRRGMDRGEGWIEESDESRRGMDLGEGWV